MSDRRVYRPPRIEPIGITTVGKHPVHDVSSLDQIDGRADVGALVEEFGSPLFVVSEAGLRASIRAFRSVFTAAGVETRIAYSYKTNYLPAVCRVFHDEGALAEVVSGMEYSLARALGVPGEDIVFNGPHKTREDLARAFAEGALVNIDGFDDLDRAVEVARASDRPARIGIRVNFRYGPAPWTKFGFSDERGESQRALERIAAEPNLELICIHNHSGTFQLDPKIYGRATEVLIDTAKRARALGMAPSIADLGGGFPSSNRLKPIFDRPHPLSPEDERIAPFAEAILNPLCRAKDAFGEQPVLMLEPGRAVVDAPVTLITTVIATKENAGHQAGVVIDAGVNLLPTAYWYDHEVGELAEGDGEQGVARRPVSIFGPLCMQIDVVRDSALLPPLTVGTPLAIANVGAYSISQSMQFIQERPAVVMMGPDGPEVIRRRETWRDVFALDEVPERLRGPGHAL